ncbi:MAG: GIY-YIG nuclease family protein [Deltaproteobacteria bacterium]|nr:GIY-YIG nuclease family protein [Deltaproteobacteria bacterium]
MKIGRWGFLQVGQGHYIYVGSAHGPGGLLSRVSRHLRSTKSKHWHIDYLLEYSTPISVFYTYNRDRLEHRWAEGIIKMDGFTPIIGFGCSDCNCQTHLFFCNANPPHESFSKLLEGNVERLVIQSAGNSQKN